MQLTNLLSGDVAVDRQRAALENAFPQPRELKGLDDLRQHRVDYGYRQRVNNIC